MTHTTAPSTITHTGKHYSTPTNTPRTTAPAPHARMPRTSPIMIWHMPILKVGAASAAAAHNVRVPMAPCAAPVYPRAHTPAPTARPWEAPDHEAFVIKARVAAAPLCRAVASTREII